MPTTATSRRAAQRKSPREPPDMRVLVTFAVEAEFAPWRRLRNFTTRKVGDITVFEAQIGRAAVDFVVTGMGLENATAVTESVLSGAHDFCIASGFAGGIRPAHNIGDVLVADAVQFLGKAKTLQCGRGLVSNATQDGAIRVKLLLTADHVVRTPAEKVGRPAVAVRVISDNYDGEIPKDVELTMTKKGQIKIGRVVRYLSKYPHLLPALIRVGRDSRTAADALAAFLEAHLKRISFFTHGWYPEGENLEQVAAR